MLRSRELFMSYQPRIARVLTTATAMIEAIMMTRRTGTVGNSKTILTASLQHKHVPSPAVEACHYER